MTETEFKQELERLGIIVTQFQLDLLEKFYDILIETNKVMNLTRIIDKKEVYLKHFYDSLTLVKIYDFSKNMTLLDIGSGAGFPGIVLKIFYPNLKITLIDALQKRVNYLNDVIKKLQLNGIEALHIRAEDLALQNKSFDIVTARAVASLPKLLQWSMPLVNSTGVFIAMKSSVDEELESSKKILDKNNYVIEKKISFVLPKEESKRSLLLFVKGK